jgi:hypothetical protein
MVPYTIPMLFSVIRLFLLILVCWLAYTYIYVAYPFFYGMLVIVLILVCTVPIAVSRLRSIVFLGILVFLALLLAGIISIIAALSWSTKPGDPNNFAGVLLKFYALPLGFLGVYTACSSWFALRWYFFHYIELGLLNLGFVVILTNTSNPGTIIYPGATEGYLVVILFVILNLLYLGFSQSLRTSTTASSQFGKSEE